MSQQKYFMVWEKPKNRARLHKRKIDAIYDHVRFRRRQKVWFLEDITEAEAQARVGKDCRLMVVGGKGNG